MSRKAWIWVLWAAATIGACWMLAAWMLVAGDRRPFLIGETTDAHHQFEIACETCHAAPAFADAAKAEKALNKACRTCHDKELRAADDSHSTKRFRSPRMAAFREKLDARLCTSCHVEHRPEITRASAVSVAMDFCVACHSEGEQDVRKNRPSHAGLGFDTCASSGCHNYHDNRALYEDFLVKHAHAEWLALSPAHALAARQRSRAPAPEAALGRDDAAAPAAALGSAATVDDWAGSGHAAAGVNCAACHAPGAPGNASLSGIEPHWTDHPGTAACEDCHRPQARTFVLGRHGMRRHPRIAKPRDPAKELEALGLGDWLPEGLLAVLEDPSPPARMAVHEARLPMRAEAAHRLLDCGSCHRPHAVDTAFAAVEACTSCHDDRHTRAYVGSPHHQLWLAELAGEAKPGTGVSCATCHMAKFKSRGLVVTNHNQNDILRPSEKMIRPVCLDCHGLRFALDALADPDLVERNFDGPPTVKVKSIDWAVRRAAAGEPEAGK